LKIIIFYQEKEIHHIISISNSLGDGFQDLSNCDIEELFGEDDLVQRSSTFLHPWTSKNRRNISQTGNAEIKTLIYIVFCVLVFFSYSIT
jgi:hypothetical protein